MPKIIKVNKRDKAEKSEKKDIVVTESKLEMAYTSMLDDIERKLGNTTGDMSNERLSTGMLTVDLIMGGGLVPGMTTIAGIEQSGKSTLMMSALRSAVASKIPVIHYLDAENSVDPRYTTSILRVKSLTEVFGEGDEKGWKILPKAFYSSDNIIEGCYDRIARVLNRLPDKIYKQTNKQWYLVVENSNKEQVTLSKNFGTPDKKYSKGGYTWYPTDNPHPQAVFFIDSYPLLLPGAVDENEKTSNGLALQARSYSQQLPRVVGKLRAKRAVIFGVNQIRKAPMVMFGSPEYEPCGEALKFNSSVRHWIGSRAVPLEWRSEPKNSKISEELSVEGRGVDQYAYKYVSNKKNKTYTPFLECWTRVWIKDSKGKGRGLDPVFDTAQFLFNVGLAKRGRKNVMEFTKTKEKLHPLNGMVLDWLDFKTLVLAEEYKDKELVEKAAKIYKKCKLDKPFSIRKFCFKILKDGTASTLMNDKLAQTSKKDDEDDE
jgi:RecA/RadA recombinase